MSMFAARTSTRGRASQYRAAQRAQGRRTLNAFAEALAECGVIAEAARQCGISQQRGSQLFARIRKELGWQAQ